MARWLVFLRLTAPDRRTAERLARARFGPEVLRVQSVPDWEEAEAERQAMARERLRRFRREEP